MELLSLADRIARAASAGDYDESLRSALASPTVTQNLSVEALPMAVVLVLTRGLDLQLASTLVSCFRYQHSSHPKVREAQGVVYTSMGLGFEAAEEFEASINDDPRGFRSWNLLAELLLEAERGEDLARVKRLSEGYVSPATFTYFSILEALVENDLRKALEHLDEWLRSESPEEDHLYYLLGAFADRGQTATAQRIWSRVEIKEAPLARAALARLHLPHNADQAVQIARQLVDEAPWYPWFKYLLASALWYCRRFDAALVYFRETSELAPWSTAAKRYVGSCLLKIGDAKGALQIAEEELQISPSSREALVLHRVASRKLGI